MSKLTLCMIVRNEEPRLAECLNSAKGAVEEIVIVDTGSTDGTVAIAESFGARVVAYPWDDDFSAARNFALEQVNSDWVLQLDADEALEAEDLPQLREFILRDDLDAVFVAIHNYERGPEGQRRTVVHAYPRLFRCRPEIRYQGLVQEFLTDLKATAFSGIRIYHYGYDCSEEELMARRQRNERICRLHLERDPENAIACFNLAGVYLCDGRLDEAREYLERASKLIEPQDRRLRHFYLMTLHYLAGLCGAKGEMDLAIGYCQQALQAEPDYLDPLFMLGEFHFRMGKEREAEDAFQGFLELRERLARQPARPLFAQSRLNSHDHVHLRLGTLYHNRGKLTQAEQHYQQAVAANPSSLNANLHLARFYTQRLDVAKAKQYLAAARRLQEAVTTGN